MRTKPDSSYAVPGFAAALREHRDRLGLTQHQLDESAGLAYGTTAQIEGGFRSPSLRNAILLAAVVELSLDRLKKDFTKK